MQRIICFSFWLTVVVSGRIGRAGEEPVWLTDFSTCTPQSALTNEPEWKQWQVIDYETDHVSGKMIGAKSFIEAPDVNLPMNVKGWHKIYVGYWNPYFEYDGGMVLRLKLIGDPCFDRIRVEAPQVGEAEQVHPGRTSIMERYWRMADVTDKNLVIGKFKGRKAYIAYIKMVPIQPEEVPKKSSSAHSGNTTVAWWPRSMVQEDGGCSTRAFPPRKTSVSGWKDTDIRMLAKLSGLSPTATGPIILPNSASYLPR